MCSTKKELANVVNDRAWRRKWSKHPNKIERYQTGRFTPIAGATVVRRDTPAYITILSATAKVDVATAMKLASVVSTIEETEDKYNPKEIRYATGISKSYLALDEKLKRLFVETTKIDHAENRVEILTFNTSSTLYKSIHKNAIDMVERLAKADIRLVDYVKPTEKFYVAVKSFKLMGIQSQITILKNIIEVSPSEGICIKKNTKQEIANYGRQYNTMNEIYNLDRQYMIGENLFGLDMESAIQVILLKLVQDVNELQPELEIETDITENFIQNKKEVREDVARLMDYRIDEDTLNIAKAKTTITAIYQGLGIHKETLALEPYFKEARDIMEHIMRYTYLKPKEKYTKYAIHRTNTKLVEKKMECEVSDYYKKYKAGLKKGKWVLTEKQRQQIRKSFTFFVWTWHERQIQNIITSYVSNPITLHDGIYTQSRAEHLILIKQKKMIQREIYQQLGIHINLQTEG